jgi:hypothetical protein
LRAKLNLRSIVKLAANSLQTDKSEVEDALIIVLKDSSAINEDDE